MEKMPKIDTLIISDVHCGLGAARIEEVTALLEKRDFKRLILLGDILHTTNLRKIKARDFSFLKALRLLGEEESGVEVVWVAGNHDIALSGNTAFFGIPVTREYEWEEGGVRHLALHGDSLYDFTTEPGVLGLLYLGAEWLLIWSGGRKAGQFFKNTIAMKRPSETLKVRAIAYGKKKGVGRIFCGHTHIEMHASNDGVEYWNAGTWLDEPSPYIAITDGKVEIRYA